MNERIRELQAEITRLEEQMQSETLLHKIWIELGPYTAHLSQDLLRELQDHFNFDDSE